MEPLVINRAPGDLELVRAFVNSKNIEAESDELSSPEHLRAWFVTRELLDPVAPASTEDLERTHQVRSALHSLLRAHNRRQIDQDAVHGLNLAASSICLHLSFHPDGNATLHSGADGVEGALGRILAIVYTAMIEGTWDRLKVCRNDGCQWAFYDPSKNRSGSWCSMAICGSRLKSRAYRRRHRHAANGT